MAITQPQPHDQNATFSYFKLLPKHEFEKPYEILIDLPEAAKHVPRTNFSFEDRECVVQDARGREEEFSLDGNGFTWRRFETSVTDFGSREVITDVYLREVEEFLSGLLGSEVKRVVIFDWRLRVSQEQDEFAKRTVDLEDGLDPLLPTMYPHIDQSPDGAAKRAQYHLPDDAAELMKGRFRIINVWRPLRTVKAWPLAVCDARSVQKGDLVLNDLVRRKYIGESYFAKYNEAHRWYYMSDQGSDEVAVLKIYDSDQKSDAKFCVHSSFKIAGDGVRESIEVRAMVFNYPEGQEPGDQVD